MFRATWDSYSMLISKPTFGQVIVMEISSVNFSVYKTKNKSGTEQAVWNN